MKFGMIVYLVLFSLTSFAQEEALQVGDTAPYFTGVDQFDSLIKSTDILDSSDNYVLIFYRGSWGKYCRKHLSAMSDSLSLISAKNTSVIVIIPETPESRERMESVTGAKFLILSDTAYTIMKAFKVDYVISKETVPRFREHIIGMTEKSNGNEDGVLPIPAT
ncbi:MAG: peroxiredoxin [Bacteroidia bacterium]|jgi:peroxiredoxin